MKITAETEWEIKPRGAGHVVFWPSGYYLTEWSLERLQCEGHRLPKEVRDAALDLLKPLADNEVRSSKTGLIYQLRWKDGKKQNGLEGEWYPYVPFTCRDSQARADAWFAANQPLAENQYKSPISGRIYTFELRDDGDVHWDIPDGGNVSTADDIRAGYVVSAAFDYRDKQRARWAVSDDLEITHDGAPVDYHVAPAWVQKARNDKALQPQPPLDPWHGRCIVKPLPKQVNACSEYTGPCAGGCK